MYVYTSYLVPVRIHVFGNVGVFGRTLGVLVSIDEWVWVYLWAEGFSLAGVR